MSKTRNPDALIRIEDAIKVLCRETCHPGVFCPDNYCAEMWDEFNDVERVDAVPVRHGRWVHHPEIGWGSTWLCSECGEKTVETVMGEPRYKFCPMCGAKMDRKDGDNGTD